MNVYSKIISKNITNSKLTFHFVFASERIPMMRYFMFVPSFALIRNNIFLNDEILYTGFLVDFISMPVTSGFTSATSIIIIVSQLQGLLGLKFKAHSIVDNLSKIFQNVQNVRIPDFLLGICSIAFLLFFRVSPFKIPHYGNKYGNKLPFDLTIYLMFLSSSN